MTSLLFTITSWRGAKREVLTSSLWCLKIGHKGMVYSCIRGSSDCVLNTVQSALVQLWCPKPDAVLQVRLGKLGEFLHILFMILVIIDVLLLLAFVINVHGSYTTIRITLQSPCLMKRKQQWKTSCHPFSNRKKKYIKIHIYAYTHRTWFVIIHVYL